jgi:allantoinase
MTRFDLIVRGGRLVGLPQTDIGIADGLIADIGPDLEGNSAREIDATGAIVLPGGIDPHVHFNEPGRTEWEGWDSGSRALIAGGVTTCIEMPLNAHPPTLDHASFDAKVAAASTSSYADFALWGGLTPDSLPTLPELAEAGVVGFKAFMSSSGTDDFRHADDDTLYQGMTCASSVGLPVAVHAENDAITAGLASRARAAGCTTMRDYLDSRPVLAETEAIARAIALAEATGCALHVVHVSTGQGVALVEEARGRGIDITCETCPHYLAFTGEDAERIGALAKCAPPLRSSEDQEELWQLIMAGDVDMIASDHSPAPPSMKEGDDFFSIWGGISGCQHLMPVALTLASGHGIPPSILANLIAHNAASRFRLPNKHETIVGFDADLVTWHPQGPAPVANIQYRHPQSAWDVFPVRYRVGHTILRGQVVFRDGAAVGPPRGRLLMPEPSLS